MTDSFKSVTKNLNKLPTIIQEKVVTRATRAGAKVISKEAKRLAPVDSGTLKISIGVAKAKKKDTDHNHVKFYVIAKSKVKKTIRATVDGKSSKLKTTAYAYHAHFQEFGTSTMVAQPFMRPAVDHKLTDSVNAFKNSMSKNIERELKKL